MTHVRCTYDCIGTSEKHLLSLPGKHQDSRVSIHVFKMLIKGISFRLSFVWPRFCFFCCFCRGLDLSVRTRVPKGHSTIWPKLVKLEITPPPPSLGVPLQSWGTGPGVSHHPLDSRHSHFKLFGAIVSALVSSLSYSCLNILAVITTQV